MNDYVNLVLHQFPIDHPEYPPYTGVFIFPVQRRAGYVRIYPYWSNKQTYSYNDYYWNSLGVLKDYLDPTNVEGRGCGKVPIGHRVITRSSRNNHGRHAMAYRIWINDGTYPKQRATDEELRELVDIINEYFQQETNAAAYTRESSPTREANIYRIKIRTSNIITALDKYKQRHPGVDSFQLDYGRLGHWVETSDDAQDIILTPNGRFRLPVAFASADEMLGDEGRDRVCEAFHGNRDLE